MGKLTGEMTPTKRAAVEEGAILGRPCSRRGLLAGTAVLAAGALAGGMAGCAPAAPQAAPTETGKGNLAASGSAVEKELNPQDDSFTAFTTDFSALFEPITLGGKEAKNRFVKSAAGSYAVNDAVNEQAVGYYRELARGGSGVVLVEFCDWLIENETSLKPIVDAIHEEGALAGAQIWGMWPQAASAKNSISQLEQTAVKDGMPHGRMTLDEIHAFQKEKVALAQLHYATGFDIIELNAGCDHTFDTFLSRFWNTERDDEYGPQSLENRARILTEMIREIKDTCPGVIVQVLYNGVEENVEQLGDSSLCISPEEAAAFGALFEEAGADMLQVRYGTFGNHAENFLTDLMFVGVPGNTGLGTQVDFSRHYDGLIDGSHGGIGALVEVAANVKKAVSIPVGTVGGLDPRLAPDLVNNAVADGKIDFVVMNRPLVADPHIPNKLKEGKRDEIRPCNHCSNCFQSVVNPAGFGYCRANAAHTRAFTEEMPEGYEVAPAEAPKKVMVIGGGPAGMEAAAVAAWRGHDVTLYEAKDSLGGTLDFAATIKGPQERLVDFKEWQARQVEQAGAKVVLGTEVDDALVQQESPDVVVIATGAVTPPPTLQSQGEVKVLSLEEAAATEVEGPVCIVGENLRALDYAVSLVRQGVEVSMVHGGSAEELAPEQAPWPRVMLTSLLEGRGSRLHHGAANVAVVDEGVKFTTSYGLERVQPAATVVACEALLPDTDFAHELEGLGEVIVVGDAEEPSSIMHAIASANLAARSI